MYKNLKKLITPSDSEIIALVVVLNGCGSENGPSERDRHLKCLATIYSHLEYCPECESGYIGH